MAFSAITTGIQHIGLPTNDIAKTIEFYESLGFTVAHRAKDGDVPVAFLKLGDLVIETYESGDAVGVNGAVDHIAMNVTDVVKARQIAADMNLEVIEEGELPFWTNGVKYFVILGPNHEKLEFNQYL